MKRAGNLFDRICSWENLELAARRARKGKRYRLYCERFELRRETILGMMREDLLSGAWQPQPYREFRIFDPKERLICAPCYRDRIVHHALCNVVGPIMERGMIDHSYSCRIGKGTAAARGRCRWLVANRRYALSLDVARFFPSVDHVLLKAKVRRLIQCERTLTLADRIIDSWQSREEPAAWFPGDELLTPLSRPRGLPIGSLTSQLFANLYLSRIDHLIEECLRPRGYIRYTDDLLLFANEKSSLRDMLRRLVDEFAVERLKPHPTKCRLHACREGIPFLGFRFFQDCVRVLQENRIRFEKRMRRYKRRVAEDRARLSAVGPSLFGWFQFVREFPNNEGLVKAESRAHVF